jgi:hypothetical protein
LKQQLLPPNTDSSNNLSSGHDCKKAYAWTTINHLLQFSSFFAHLLAQDICFDAKNFKKNILKNLPKAKKKQSQIKLALIFSLQARAREQLRVASHRRLGLCLRFEPLFRFFRSKIPRQTKPRTTATAIGRIALIEPPLLTVSTVSW